MNNDYALVKTHTLSGVALDWAVATCDGVEISNEALLKLKAINDDRHTPMELKNAYSIDWAEAGPIIEEFKIEISPYDDTQWRAIIFSDIEHRFMQDLSTGNSPLEAAMRCFVSLKLGDEVQVPNCLIQQNKSPTP